MLKFFLRKKIIIIVIVIAVILIGGKLFFDSKKAPQDFKVVRMGDIKEELTLSGKINADDYAVLRFEVAGRLNWVGVKEGDWIKKGQAIATLEKETLEATLRKAWQDFTAAKAASDEYYDGRSGDPESYAQKIERTALDATQNKAYDSIRIAQENLKSAVLYSPFEGLVVSAEPSLAGINISTLNSSYEVVNPETIYLQVTADQTEIGGLKEGQKGTMIFDSYPEEKIEGIVENISFTPAKDETGTVYNVKVAFGNVDNKDYKYRLGMTADIDFAIKEKNDALIVSAKYIDADEKGKFVLVGEDKEKKYVKTGIESSQDVEIISGLSEGDVIYD